MEPNTASFAKPQSKRTVLGDVPCKLCEVVGPIHLIGIGGIGMSALARLLLGQGRTVSGSDKQSGEITQELEKLGATIYIGHEAANASQAAAVVVSTAITADNPEVDWALAHNLPVFHRSAVLAALAYRKNVIAISGTHGKTTTTAMVAQVLIDCGVDPSVVVGGIFAKIGSNAYSGQGNYFVAESDESDGTHSSFNSHIAVITSVEADHLENYPGGIAQIYESMTSFGNHAELATIICYDDAGCQAILPHLKGRVVSYGQLKDKSTAGFQFENLDGFAFRVYKNKTLVGELELTVPGEHNKLNAMAAIAVAFELGLDSNAVFASLSQFKGVDRRFQFIGEKKNILVIDDYAHHPTEIVETLKAARLFIKKNNKSGGTQRRLVAVFQPHQPRRLQDFWVEFCNAFGEADLVLVSDIYVARGGQIEGVNSRRLAEEIKHPDCHYLPAQTEDLALAILRHVKQNDLVLTIGAGDITSVGPKLIKLLQEE